MSDSSSKDNSSTAGIADYKRLNEHAWSWDPLPLTPAIEGYIKTREGKQKPTVIDPRNETPTNERTTILSCTPELSARFTPLPHTIYQVLDFIRPSDGKRIDKPGVFVRQVHVFQRDNRRKVVPIGGSKSLVHIYYVHAKIQHEICSSEEKVISPFSFKQEVTVMFRYPDGTSGSAPMKSFDMSEM